MKRDGLALVGALVIAALVAGIGLTAHPFWDDEANTALFARNLRATGHLSAWDGTNVVGFRQGAELSPKLLNQYMPPVQYGLCALGQAIFGDTTFGGRFPFYLCGVLAVGVLFFLVRYHLGGLVPPFLPALLVALSPAFALYIRQCRYYSVAVLLSLGVLLGFVLAAQTGPRRLVAIFGAAVCAGLLMFTNYLNAVALLAGIPIFFLLRRYRSRDHVRCLCVVYAVALVAGIVVLITANPFSSVVVPADSATGLPRFFKLLWWHVTGLGRFEFFPLGVAILLLVAFVVDRKRRPPLIGEGLLIVLFLIVCIAATAIFSPQPVGVTLVADMRYVVPLITIGAIAGGCLIVQLWRWHKLMRPVAIVVTLLICLTNLLHLSFFWGEQKVAHTLLRYLGENLHPYTSGTSELVNYAKMLPTGSAVRIFPDFMTYPAMYYVPKLHYVDQLAASKNLDPRLAASLPDYVFAGRVAPDYFIVGGVPTEAALKLIHERLGQGTYFHFATLPGDYADFTRPEIPWHRFAAPSPAESQPFVVMKKVVRASSPAQAQATNPGSAIEAPPSLQPEH